MKHAVECVRAADFRGTYVLHCPVRSCGHCLGKSGEGGGVRANRRMKDICEARGASVIDYEAGHFQTSVVGAGPLLDYLVHPGMMEMRHLY